MKGNDFLISPPMKQADIPHASRNTKKRTKNNANMNIISLLNNIVLVKKEKEKKPQISDSFDVSRNQGDKPACRK